jgi:2-iminobutanoate/2-iminopropanoate deaminase
VLDAAGSSLEAIVKTTVFLSDLDDWAAMNSVYRRFVGDVPPARSAIESGRLAFGARVEIDAIALVAAA